MDAEYDAIVIGAGVSGLYMLHRLRGLGLSVRVFEAGNGVGGTWYWNRYPGCRFDSESYTYGYAFDEALLHEWHWSEHFSAQPETLRYLEHVADRFDLRRDISFGARVAGAVWDDTTQTWEISLEDGTSARAALLITAIGALSSPAMPRIVGMDTFVGPAFHTARWPHAGLELDDKRVAVIGTGASGVQLIAEAAKVAKQLTVYQRRPNWCAPLHNAPIEEHEQKHITATHHEIIEQCKQTFGQFIHDADERKALEQTALERHKFWEHLYSQPGFGIWMGNYRDVLVNADANLLLSDFVADKIRGRVHDQTLAEKLIPKDHGFGTRRVPLETRYYEVYNQPNVDLVDLRDTPIEEITPYGIRTRADYREHDAIVYATGFDAVTGGFDRIDLRGRDGLRLRDAWREGPRTFLGLQTPGFPNLFTLVGPHNASTFCNMPRCIEQNVEWVADLVAHMRGAGATVAEATDVAADEWTAHVHNAAERMLFSKIDSWFTGVSTNIEGHTQRRVLLYAGGAANYRERCDDVAAAGYAGLRLS